MTRPTASGTDHAVARIMLARRDLTHLLAFARSGPLLAANLTMSQLKVLLALSRHDDASGQELTAALGVSLATTTGIVDRLVARDLVTRREDQQDRRIRRVALTPTGRELVDSIITAGAQHQRRLLGRLDANELDIVERAFQLLLDAATAEAAETGTGHTGA
jgi:DNA-binding MarR family transcriptional regulator